MNVNLKIPDHIFERAKRVAQNQNVDVADIVTQILDKGLPAVDSAVPSPNKKQEIEAFHRLHPTLLEKYPGEYAAIHNQQLVDHDANRAALLKRITHNFPNVFVLVRPIQENPEIILHHRSTRWSK